MTTAPDARRLTSAQHDAPWTWRPQGWRGSTPTFKASVIALAVAACGLAMIVVALAVATS